MKPTPTPVPVILEHLNPVTEHFGPISKDTGKMQIPDTMQDIPRFVYELLTETEQAMCDKVTD